MTRARARRVTGRVSPLVVPANAGARFKREVQLGGEPRGADARLGARSRCRDGPFRGTAESGLGIGTRDHGRCAAMRSPGLSSTTRRTVRFTRIRLTGEPGRMVGTAGGRRPLRERLAQVRPTPPAGCESPAPPLPVRRADTAASAPCPASEGRIRAEHGVEAESALESSDSRNAPRAGRKRSCRRCAGVTHVVAPESANAPRRASQERKVDLTSRGTEPRRHARHDGRQCARQALHCAHVSGIGQCIRL